MALNVTGGALEFQAIIDQTQFGQQINRIESQLKGLTDTANRESAAIENFARKAALSVGTFFSARFIGNFITEIGRVRGEFQQLEVAFETMLGSKEKSQKLLAQLTEFAAKTPFELTEVAAAAKQLLAFGLSAEKIEGTLRTLGDVASGLGQPLGEIAYLYGTIKTAGVANSVDLKQFAQRGIPIFEALSAVLKVNREEIGAMVSAGKIGFPEIEKAFQNLTAEGSKFGGLMEAQSKTLVGMSSNLRDAFDKMLNDIGKSTEGIFASTIKGATFLVENYQKVLDIIKVLIITYGSYKAAVIATVVVQRVQQQMLLQQALAGRSLNTIQALNAVLTRNLTAAWKALNLTMKLNPIGLVIGLTVALVSAIAVFSDRTNAQEKAQRSLNEANKEYAEQLETIKNRTNELVNIIGSETTTRLSQVRAFDELKKLYPDMLRNMDLMSFKTLSAEDAQKRFNKSLEETTIEKLKKDYQDARAEVDRLTASLKDARDNNLPYNTIPVISESLDIAKEKFNLLAQEVKKYEDAAWEANTPLEDQIKHFDNIKTGLINQRTEAQKNIDKLFEMGRSAFDFKVIMEQINLKNLTTEIDNVQIKLNALRGTDVDVNKNKAFFTKQKNDAQAEIDKTAVSDKNFNKIKEEQTKIIRQADIELAKYDTDLKKTTVSTKDANKAERERKRLLEDSKNLIKSIDDLILESAQSGLTDEAKILSEINEKYDNKIADLKELNELILKFNKANKTNIPLLQGEDSRINSARQNELSNLKYKQDAEKFIESLKEKEKAFDQYQEAIDSGNELISENARKEYANQLGDYENFIDLLKAELEALELKVIEGNANVGDQINIDKINKLIQDAQKKSDESVAKKRLDNFNKLVAATETFRQKELDINKKYDDLQADLLATNLIKNKDEASKIIEDQREKDLNALRDEIARNLPEFKKLFDGIEKLSDKAAKKIIDDARKQLAALVATGKISAELAKEVSAALDEASEALSKRLPERLRVVSSVLGTLAGPIGELNKELGETIQLMSDMTSIAADAASAIASFAVGDIAGAISSATSAISGIIEGFAKAKKSKEDAKQAILDFQAGIIAGEQEYAALVREREREQILANKLTLEGLKDQNELLKEQKRLNEEAFQDVLKKIQAESFISGESTKRKRGSLLGGLVGFFSGTRTVVEQELSSLAGKTFDEIEKLFLSGQLTDSAKALFEQLQKIKAEGVDIDALLLENAERLKEVLTGTTSDSITDSIVDGFRNGLNSAEDFAGTFEELMRGAIINSLKFKYLEGPLKDFFAEFAEASESDSTLTAAEIDELKNLFNSIITNANKQFEDLQKIAGINFSSDSTRQQNTLTGAFRTMTEDTGNILVGQFNGQRVATLTLVDIQKTALGNLNNIEGNTANTVIELKNMVTKIEYYYRDAGVKMR